MNKQQLSILQLGKFFPIRGGVEKVAYDLTVGLSEQDVHCDMTRNLLPYMVQGGSHDDISEHDSCLAEGAPEI